MRIVYVGKHGQANNDDEGSIVHALSELGHDVTPVQEGNKYTGDGDLLLFHHWNPASDELYRYDMPKAFWCFDLIHQDEPAMHDRNERRERWAVRMEKLCDIGFMTDGGWLAKVGSDKLHHLTQGADGRIAGLVYNQFAANPELLFTGIRNGGKTRESFVEEMKEHYRGGFRWETKGVYRGQLRDLMLGRIVVCPDCPVGPRYWSNRVYVALGFGAFVIHPWCWKLLDHYTGGQEIVYYHNRADLHNKIAEYRARPDEMARIAEAGLQRTLREHLYLHRCAKLIQTVKEQLKI